MTCTNPNCSFDIDGICAEGHDEGDCPNNHEDSSSIDIITPDSIAEANELIHNVEPIEDNDGKKKRLKGQSPLSIAEVQEKIKSREGKFVAFIGPVGVGKTTLISSIYDAFNRNNNLSMTFGGSDTLYAFENLCHSARITSRSDKVDTPRTSATDGVKFYHLTLKDKLSHRQELFLSDRAGESYEEITNDISKGKELSELGRSNLVLFLVDSLQLSTSSSKNITRHAANTLITSIHEAVPTLKLSRCYLLLTKFDLVKGTELELTCTVQANMIVEHVLKKVSCELKILDIAARTAKATTDKFHGFEPLFSLMASSEFPTKQIEVQYYATNRSFHNMELVYG